MKNGLTVIKKNLTKNGNYGFDISMDNESEKKCHACKKLLFKQKGDTVIIKCKCGKYNYIKIQ